MAPADPAPSPPPVLATDPACANCGYCRGGLAGPSAPCPECGVRSAPAARSPAWVGTCGSSLRLLCWAIPAGLLAWASPTFLDLGHEPDSVPLVRNASWLVLIASGPIVFALLQLTRCLPPTAGALWCARLAPIALLAIALDAAGATSLVVSLCAHFGDDSQAYSYSIWSPVLCTTVAGAAFPAVATLASAAREAGLPRVGSRLSKIAPPAIIAGLLLTLWSSEGRRVFAEDWLIASSGQSPSVANRLALFSIDQAGALAAVAIVVLALACWHAAALARAQVVAPVPAPPGAAP